MKLSKMIALSAVSSALSLVFLVLGAYIEVLELSCIFLAALCMMLPLAKKTYLGGFLAYVASALLAFIFSAGRYNAVIAFALFFGLHPLVNALQDKLGFNKYLAFLIKAIWFDGAMLVLYFFTTLVTGLGDSLPSFIQDNIILFIIVAGVFAFFVYDLLMRYFQRAIDNLVIRLKI